MIDDNLVNKLGDQLFELRDARAEAHPPAEDLNELIADMINGLETLFIIVNATATHAPKPQGTKFVSVSEPNKPKMI